MLQALANYLIANGYTSYSLAEAMGVSQPTVSRLTSGTRTNINAEAAFQLIRLVQGNLVFPPAVRRYIHERGESPGLLAARGDDFVPVGDVETRSGVAVEPSVASTAGARAPAEPINRGDAELAEAPLDQSPGTASAVIDLDAHPVGPVLLMLPPHPALRLITAGTGGSASVASKSCAAKGRAVSVLVECARCGRTPLRRLGATMLTPQFDCAADQLEGG